MRANYTNPPSMMTEAEFREFVVAVHGLMSEKLPDSAYHGLVALTAALGALIAVYAEKGLEKQAYAEFAKMLLSRGAILT